MAKSVRPIIESLFASSKASNERVRLSWRLVRRRGRPFMLVPEGLSAARTGLNLYSAQRWQAKFGRTLFPLLLQTPASRLFERIQFEAEADSELFQFIGEQTGIPASHTALSGIKLSEVGNRSRLVLLLCDESGRPTRVIKAGLNEAGQQATNLEAEILAQLPQNTIGCIRMTGRIRHRNFSAFATDYFPGESPQDDAGMEQVFHTWLNHAERRPIEDLHPWEELASAAAKTDPQQWQLVKSRLHGKMVNSTLYHGDFAPWNVRAVNSKNLQAFDWERGSLTGLPGWDWFHFIIQTAILARGCSIERTAAEVDQLLRSNRFKKYAAAAGISDIAEPLVLAYLLHHIWVIKPSEGAKASSDLLKLLATHWNLTPASPARPQPATAPPQGYWATARQQIAAAAHQLANLFWEPTLNASHPPPFQAQARRHWRSLVLAITSMAAVATGQYFLNALVFLPFFMLICGFLTWKVDRRWGAAAATIAAAAGPIIVSLRDNEFKDPQLLIWNTMMRFILLQICVLFVDRIHRLHNINDNLTQPMPATLRFGDVWAILLASVIQIGIAVGVDLGTNPNMNVLPFYLLPCMLVTLMLNLRWGLAVAFLAMSAATIIDFVTHNHERSSAAGIFAWNNLMRLAVPILIILLLDCIRRKDFLLFHRKPAADRN